MIFYNLTMLLTIKLALNNPGNRKFTFSLVILTEADLILSWKWNVERLSHFHLLRSTPHLTGENGPYVTCACAHAQLVSPVCAPRTTACQAPLSLEFSRTRILEGFTISSHSRDLPDWGSNLCLLRWQVDSLLLPQAVPYLVSPLKVIYFFKALCELFPSNLKT